MLQVRALRSSRGSSATHTPHPTLDTTYGTATPALLTHSTLSPSLY